MGHRISVTFIARIISGDAKAADDAESIQLLPLDDQTNLAFDHNKILKDYQQWKKSKIRVIKNIASEIKRFYFMVSILSPNQKPLSRW